MAKICKGKLPAGQTEISIITFGDMEPIRSFDRGLTARQTLTMASRKKIAPGTPVKVEWAIVENNGRGAFVRSLGGCEGIVYAPGTVPMDAR